MTADDQDRQDSESDLIETIKRIRRKHDELWGNRKKFTPKKDQEIALLALADGVNGADFYVLELFSALVSCGHEINPDFQRIANIIVAKSVLSGSLPSKNPRGRPKDEDNGISRSIAWDYYALLDSGLNSEDAANKLSMQYHKSPRHIMRFLKLGKHYLSNTKERRELDRQYIPHPNDYQPTHYIKIRDDLEKLEREAFEKILKHEFIDQLDDMIDAELARKTLTDKKST